MAGTLFLDIIAQLISSSYLISLTLRWLEFKHVYSVSVGYAGTKSPPVRWLELQTGISQAG